MKRTRSPHNLVWIDLEMTGLDPATDAIVQAAVVITDPALTVLEEYCCDVWQPPAVMDLMTPFVRDMHTKSGLIDRVAKSRTDQRAAEKHLLERISGWCDYPATLCGNSVGQDKRFLDNYMPGVARYLHYRIVDVSSLKVLLRLWYGDDAEYKKPDELKHDALFDIHQSIAELAFYRKRYIGPQR
ncbi:MAG TPA: oligoribonuclease [Polyangiaceae bacterium]